MPSSAGARPDRLTLVLFLLLALTWGSSFLFIKVGLEGLSPGQVSLGRMLFGAVTLVGIMLATRRAWPRDPRIWGHLLVVGALLCSVPFTLFAWAEQFVPSGLASVYNATTPLMALLALPLIFPAERLTISQRIGVGVGALGIVVVAAPWRYFAAGMTPEALWAQLALLGATACYGFGTVYTRRFVSSSRLDSIQIAALQMVLGAGLLILAAPFQALSPMHLSWGVVAAIAALGIFGTGLAYVWMTRVIRQWGAARASTVTYLTPIVGVALGMLVLGETIHWHEPVGGVIVILGILLAQGVVRTSQKRTRGERDERAAEVP